MTILKLALISSIPAATTTLAVVETVAADPSWTPAQITAIFLGLTTLLTSLLNAWLTHRAKHEVKAEVKEVYHIVDGGNTTLMKEIRDLKEQRAESSKRTSDHHAAEVAATAVSDKEATVASAAATKKE